jgi:S-adenosylmethionine synthetase
LYPDSPAPITLDLLDTEKVNEFFRRLQADESTRITHLIHCAAERRPDVAEADPARASALNERTTEDLSRLARELRFGLVYISTDYVFDGKKPPYKTRDETNPLNLYGKLKRGGEEAVLKVRKAMEQEDEMVNGRELVVFRVPLL